MTQVDAPPFWKTVPPEQMNDAQWESLCDRCGRCCLHSFEDEDSGDIGITGVACRYLDLHSCACTRYPKRRELVPACLVVPRRGARDLAHLPETCGYRRIDAGLPLPDWHPLISGSYETVHQQGSGARGRVISEEQVPPTELAEHIIAWVSPDRMSSGHSQPGERRAREGAAGD